MKWEVDKAGRALMAELLKDLISDFYCVCVQLYDFEGVAT